MEHLKYQLPNNGCRHSDKEYSPESLTEHPILAFFSGWWPIGFRPAVSGF
jgi:hypothetical protein